MRVLFYTVAFPPQVGGLERISGDLVRSLAARGIELMIVAPQPDESIAAHADLDGIPVRRLAFDRALYENDVDTLLSIRRAVRAIKREFRPDLIHINGLHVSTAVHLDTRSASEAPELLTLHGWGIFGGRVPRWVDRLFAGVDWVTVCSEATRQRVLAALPDLDAKSSVIHNGWRDVDRPPSPIRFDPPTILCLGRMDANKGFDVAIRAFERIAGSYPTARLVVGGDGNARAELESLARHSGVGDRIDFPGLIAPSEVADWIDRASFVAVPTLRHEGFGLVALEAMMLGRPVVASDVEGLPEVVEDARTGVIVKSGDVEALASAMASLLDEPERVRALGEAACERSRLRFPWSDYVDRFAELYERLSR